MAADEEMEDTEDDEERVLPLEHGPRASVLPRLWKVCHCVPPRLPRSPAPACCLRCGLSSTLSCMCSHACRAQIMQPHQRDGVRWLAAAFSRGGGVLADEPGLGKTLQLIVLCQACCQPCHSSSGSARR